MSWESELREEIRFSSPNFNLFNAKWKNDERSASRKLGIFGPPKFKGEIVQDLGVKSTLYPLNIFFDGFFHNKDADEFFEACTTESGAWEVIHPVKGPLILQLVSVREVMAPVDAGNYTEFQTEWIEPANITRLISPAELAASILNSALSAIGDAQLILTQLRADAYSAIQSTINTINKVAGFSDNVLAEITATDALVQESYLSARAALDGALAEYGIGESDPSGFGEATANVVTSPVNASNSFSQRFTAYNNMATEILTLTPSTTTEDDFNTVSSQEFSIALALIAIAQTTATSVFSTRADVISAMENLTDIFNSSTAALDEIQDAFSGLDIDFQYFSETQTYTSLINLYALAMQYLITQFFNLSAEKKFTLKTARSPIEITVTEYGELGDSDVFYNLFLESNKLSGNDILLLNPGREVVIYV